MDKAYHTLNEGIPAEDRETSLGMGAENNREWLHLWLSSWGKEGQLKKSLSVHLSRQDALNLIEEISYRLF